MFIDEKEAARRLAASEKLLKTVNKDNGSHISSTVQGTPKETEEISEKGLKDLLNISRYRGSTMSTKERADVGLAGILLGGRAAGQLYGRGPDTSHELRHGYRSQHTMYPENGLSKDMKNRDQELVDKISEQKETVRDLAFDRLTSSIGLISHEKLKAVTDVTKLARVSRDLATVVDKTLPKDNVINSGVHFHIWKPEMKDESAYETINVNSPLD